MNNEFQMLRAANEQRMKLWHPNGSTSLEFKGLELSGESGELCNGLKKYCRFRDGMAGGVSDISNIVDEMADVIICVDLISLHFDVDLWEAVQRKFNATSNKHGFLIKL